MIIRFSSNVLYSSMLLLAAAATNVVTVVNAAAVDTPVTGGPVVVEPDVVVSSWMANTGGRTSTSSESESESNIGGYRPIKTEVGKKIRFEWSSSSDEEEEGQDNNDNDNNINVYIHQNLNCDPTNSILIGTTSPTDFVWTEEFANKQWLLTSHVPNNNNNNNNINNPCESGQFVLVQVDEAPKPTWTIRNWSPPPDGQGFAPLDVVVGETIKWEWTSTTNHNDSNSNTNDVDAMTVMKKDKQQLVSNGSLFSSSTTQTVFAHKGSKLDCFFKNDDGNNDITFIGPADIDTNPQSPMTSAWYTFTEDDGSRDGRTMWFTSTSDECFRGNILTVTVYSTQADLELAHRRPVNCRTGSGCRPQDKDPQQQPSSSSSSSTGSRTDLSGKDESSSNYNDLFPGAASSSSGGNNNRPDKPNNGSDRDRDDTTEGTLPADGSGATAAFFATTTTGANAAAGLIFSTTTIIMMILIVA